MGKTSMGSTNFDRIRPVAQLASVLLLVVAMTVSVQLRHQPREPPAAVAAAQREGRTRPPGCDSAPGAGPRAAAGGRAPPGAATTSRAQARPGRGGPGGSGR